MPESALAAWEYFSGATAAAAASAGTEGAVIAADAAVGAGAAAGASGLGSAALAGAAGAVGSGVVGALLKPSTPGLPPPTPMPDPLAQEEARKQSLIEQMARRGRASTILTAPASGDGKLGG